MGLQERVQVWTHWDLNPGPSACEADVMPLHHVPSHVLFVIHVYTACFVLPHWRGFANLFIECCRLLVLQQVS